MRQTLLGPAALALALSALGCASTCPVIGSWEMVENNGQALPPVAPSERPVKILNATHFAFGSQRPDGSVWAGGGRYSWDRGLYAEFIGWHSASGLVGQTAVFHDRLEGDLWYHAGTITARDGGRVRIDEVWRRLAAPATARADRPPRSRIRDGSRR